MFGADLVGQAGDWKLSNAGNFGGRAQFLVQQGKLMFEGYLTRGREVEFPESYVLALDFGARDRLSCAFCM